MTPLKRCLVSAAVALAALGPVSAARALDQVHAGIVNSTADVPFFIADAKGYFKAEGLEVDLVHFAGAAQMVAPLGTGELDVGSGAISVGFYNALARGIELKIVADKAHNGPGYGFSSLLVRKALVESGKFKTYKDLKGLKIALSAAGTSDELVLNEALKLGGLKWGDADIVYLGFTRQPGAFENGAIDASLTGEPAVTYILHQGAAVRFKHTDEFYPGQQTSVLIYGTPFIARGHDLPVRLMRAYLRAVRFYNDALAGGHLAGPTAPEVIAILARYLNVKDPEIYREITPQACDPDGRVNAAALEKDWQFFKDSGQIDGKVTAGQAIDPSFATAAVASLGPYRPAQARH